MNVQEGECIVWGWHGAEALSRVELRENFHFPPMPFPDAKHYAVEEPDAVLFKNDLAPNIFEAVWPGEFTYTLLDRMTDLSIEDKWLKPSAVLVLEILPPAPAVVLVPKIQKMGICVRRNISNPKKSLHMAHVLGIEAGPNPSGLSSIVVVMPSL